MASSPLPHANDLRAGARLAIANAQDLVESAEILAGHGKVGAAQSLLILALEEAAKAKALAGEWSRYWVRQRYPEAKDIRWHIDRQGKEIWGERHFNALLQNLLRTHSARHFAAALEVLASSNLGALQEAWSEEARRLDSKRPDFGTLLASLSEKYPDEDTLSFLASAQDRKEKGLYVDWNSGAWQSPGSVSRYEYDTAVGFAGAYVRHWAAILLSSTLDASPES